MKELGRNSVWALATVVLVGSSLLMGCAKRHSKTMAELAVDASKSPPPARVERPINQSLLSFGKMVRVYTGYTDPLIVEVDFIANDSGVTQELPNDLGYYAVKALGTIGTPFRTTRTYSTIALHGGANAAANLGEMSQVKSDVKLKGLLLRASTRVERERDGGGGIQTRIGGGSNNAVNIGGQAAADRKLTGMRVGFHLTTPEGISYPGPTAEYEVLSKKEVNDAEFRVEVFGVGGNYMSRVVVNNDAGDAISDATAACVMQLVGHWLMVPYYRCDPTMQPDVELKQRLYSLLSEYPESRLELILKGFLNRLGVAMDPGAELTERDRASIAAEMQSRIRLELSRENLVRFYMHLWETADFEVASKRVEQLSSAQMRQRTETAQRQAEAEAAAEQAADPVAAQAAAAQMAAQTATVTVDANVVRPEDFGWSAGTSFIMVDSAALPDNELRVLFFETVRKMPECKEIRKDNKRATRFGVQLNGTPAQWHASLRRSQSLQSLNFTWTSNSYNRLVVTPRPQRP
ncbi:MAG: hypothetical protein FWD53_02515 [Phycisphaerales bacterium]|nr:hypothetical protein [Phycisphaerales bacterium]